ncbi:MAG: hypothetical protein JKY65_28740 [Planctomycetes bacterium]|nr:hypothetical protein [Planctomycetota bacterium]
MSDCPGADLFLLATHDLIEEPLDAKRFSDHLEDCEACQGQRTALEGALAAPPLPTPPPEVLAALHERIAKEEVGAPRPLPTDVRIRLLCTYCKDDLDEDTTVYCAACLAPCHSDCFEEHGRCAAPGCEGANFVQVRRLPPAPAARPLRIALIALSALVGAGVVAAISPPDWGSTQTQTAGSALSQEVGKESATYVGGAIVFTVSWEAGDRPQMPSRAPSDSSPEPEGALLVDDTVAKVEWILPEVEGRSLFLVSGVGEGVTTFKLFFPSSGRAVTYNVDIAGEDPHPTDLDKRQLELQGKSARELNQASREHYASAERYWQARDLPNKEGFYRKAYLGYGEAFQTALALAVTEEQHGRQTKAREWAEKCLQAEQRAVKEWEERLAREISRYRRMVANQARARNHVLRVLQLRVVLRLIQHSCDVRYLRFEAILRERYESSLPEQVLCDYELYCTVRIVR